jgi:hypothetical protein
MCVQACRGHHWSVPQHAKPAFEVNELVWLEERNVLALHDRLLESEAEADLGGEGDADGGAGAEEIAEGAGRDEELLAGGHRSCSSTRCVEA